MNTGMNPGVHEKKLPILKSSYGFSKAFLISLVAGILIF